MRDLCGRAELASGRDAGRPWWLPQTNHPKACPARNPLLTVAEIDCKRLPHWLPSPMRPVLPKLPCVPWSARLVRFQMGHGVGYEILVRCSSHFFF